MAIEVSVVGFVGFVIAKNVFQVHGLDRRAAAVLRKRLRQHADSCESDRRSCLKAIASLANPIRAIGA